MMRKIALILAALLLGAAVLSARSHPGRYSPYQHGYRWFMSIQAGPAFSVAEHLGSFAENGQAFGALSWHGAISFGYNFTDAWAFRISGVYGYNSGACSPYQGFYPYHFHAAHLFADILLDYNALGEYNAPFTFKSYAGIGAAYTFGFTEVVHPYQVLDSPNFSPAFRLGGIFEYDRKNGVGWFADLGAEACSGWYNGQEPEKFPLYFNFKVSLGFIYHFPLGK